MQRKISAVTLLVDNALSTDSGITHCKIYIRQRLLRRILRLVMGSIAVHRAISRLLPCIFAEADPHPAPYKFPPGNVRACGLPLPISVTSTFSHFFPFPFSSLFLH